MRLSKWVEKATSWLGHMHTLILVKINCEAGNKKKKKKQCRVENAVTKYIPAQMVLVKRCLQSFSVTAVGARNPGCLLARSARWSLCFVCSVGLIKAQRTICEGAGGISGAGTVHCTCTDFKIHLQHNKLLCQWFRAEQGGTIYRWTWSLNEWASNSNCRISLLVFHLQATDGHDL